MPYTIAKANYRQSAKGKAAAKRYRQSAKGKVVERKYRQSAKGKAAQRKYNQSVKGKAARTVRAVSRSIDRHVKSSTAMQAMDICNGYSST
jgi:hypothetical protein